MEMCPSCGRLAALTATRSDGADCCVPCVENEHPDPDALERAQRVSDGCLLEATADGMVVRVRGRDGQA